MIFKSHLALLLYPFQATTVLLRATLRFLSRKVRLVVTSNHVLNEGIRTMDPFVLLVIVAALGLLFVAVIFWPFTLLLGCGTIVVYNSTIGWLACIPLIAFGFVAYLLGVDSGFAQGWAAGYAQAQYEATQEVQKQRGAWPSV